MQERQKVLSQAFYLDKEIKGMIEERDTLKRAAEKSTTTYSETPSRGSKNTSRTEDLVIAVVDMDREIDTKVDQLVNIKEQIREAVSTVKDRKQRTVMTLRYLYFFNWIEIAREMNITVRHAMRLNQCGIESLNDSLNIFNNI